MDNNNIDSLVQSILNGQEIASLASNADIPEEEKQNLIQLDLWVSSNSMQATVTVKPAYEGQKVWPETILQFLKERGIQFGIQEEAIRSYCEAGDYSEALVCALGQEVVDGSDGQLIYHFDTDKMLRPAERSDGSLDFRELGLVKNIAAGEVLCSIQVPSQGSDGMDIMGRVQPHKQGKMPVLPAGTNTQISEDGLTLTATVDGCIDSLQSAINVTEVYALRGDVGRSSGNITAKGSVVISGDVKTSFFVKAGGSITVHGIVENAVLEAGGNIVLTNGMNGGGKGRLTAGGSISGKFFENTILEAGENIYANIIMSSSIKAGGALILSGSSGTLVGGECQVGHRIYAKNIGNPAGVVTRISIESRELSALLAMNSQKQESPELIEQKLAKTKQELQEFDEKYEVLSAQFLQKNPPDGGASFQLIKSAAQQKKTQFQQQIQELETKLVKSKQSLNSLLDFHVIAQGFLYPGTKLSIANYKHNIIREESNAKFYLGFDGITSGPILPSDQPEAVR